jgi:hypothetical protein
MTRVSVRPAPTPQSRGASMRGTRRWHGTPARVLRHVGGAVLATALLLAALLVSGSPASAAGDPTLITINGGDLGAPVAVHSDSQPDLFTSLLRQVSWMQGAVGTPMAIDEAKLGAKYTVTVSTGAAPAQVYDLYPAAGGGPRAHRPAAQPSGTTADAWFYAPLSLPDVLRSAGVQVADTALGGDATDQDLQQASLHGGTGTEANSVKVNFRNVLGPMKTAVLTSVGTSLAALLLLFAAARFSRYRYRRRISG